MSTDLTATVADEAAIAATEAQPAKGTAAATALTVLFAATAVLLVSFLAVVMALA